MTVTSIKDTNQTTQKAKLLGWKENLVWAILAVCGLGVWWVLLILSATVCNRCPGSCLLEVRWDPAEQRCDLLLSQIHMGTLCLEGDLTSWLPPIHSFIL